MLALTGKGRLAHLLVRLSQRLRVRYFKLVSTNSVQGAPTLNQPLFSAGRGRICFGDGVRIGVLSSPGFLSTYAYIEARNESASIKFGSGIWINNNFCCVAEHTSVSIGNRCLIGPNVEITDSDFHGAEVEHRSLSKPEWASAVEIGDDVFIGSNVRILKGARIGQGSVIANSSVVLGDVPANTIVAGVPARVVREIGQ